MFALDFDLALAGVERVADHPQGQTPKRSVGVCYLDYTR
ncbi:hypothetical protein VCRA2113O137_440004 [Vibrio crassostreae]|nr:hypothetical protein VCRA2113O137_440004 [Vibrio crassostreae]